jgi:hypothetical protein
MTTSISISSLTLVLCALLCVSAGADVPTIPQDPNAEMSFDGLVRVDNSRMDNAWMKRDLNIKNYNKILPVNAGIEFRAVKPASKMATRDSSTNEFPLNLDQKTRVADIIIEVFQSELAKFEHFTITDQPAPDALMIVGKLIDVVSHVPPESTDNTKIYLSNLGEATLVMEIRDSQSGEILARAVDRRAAYTGMIAENNVVTNISELRTFSRHWARLIRKRLDEFRAM